jgi:hypothetical protein
MSPLSIGLILSSAVCTVATQMLLKGAGSAVTKILHEAPMGGLYKLPIFIFSQPLIISAVILQGFGFLLWIAVLSKESAATALGLGGASVYLLTALAEWAIYDIRLSATKAIALILISVGALLLSTLNN